jgi:8-oxo-dGTP diphosphatase
MTTTSSSLPRHSVSVAGIVFNEHNKVLAIQRRDNNQWQPPGGVLELGETFEEGVQREVLEETGIHVRVDRLTGVYKNMTMGVVALVFRCMSIGGTPQATDESRDIQWLDLADALTLMPPTFAIRVQDAASLSTAAHRTHDGTAILRPSY